MAAFIDKKTPHLGLPLPDVQNRQTDDCERIAAALTGLDANAKAVATQLEEHDIQLANTAKAMTDLESAVQANLVDQTEEIDGKLAETDAKMATLENNVTTALANAKAVVMAAPAVTGSELLPLDVAAELAITAEPGLLQTTVAHFVVTIDGGAPEQVPATENRATLSVTIPSSKGEAQPVAIVVKAVDSLGNVSQEATWTGTTIRACVKQPSVLTPESGAEVVFSGGIGVALSAFETIGMTDTHVKSSYKVTDASGGTIAEDLDTTDLVSHTIPGSKLSGMVEGQEYRIQGQHEGQALGKSAWSAPAIIHAKLGVTCPEGDVLLYRYGNNKGSVIEFEAHNKHRVLLVPDAIYRTQKQWGQYNMARNIGTMNPAPQTSGTTRFWYGSNQSGTVGALPALTIAQLEANANFGFTAGNYYNARELCEQWLAFRDYTDSQSIKGVPAVEYARSLTDIIAGGCDIPNPEQLAILYKVSELIDANDPTIESAPTYKLGHSGSYRWTFGGANLAWSCCEFSATNQWFASYYGYSNNYFKYNSFGVLPVRELS